MGDKNSRQLAAYYAALITASPDLDPDVMQGWIDNPASLARVLKGVLAPSMDGLVAWSVWRTLTIGGVSRDDLTKRLLEDGFFVSDWTQDIMSKKAFTTLPEPIEVQLVRIQVHDLGFTKEPTTAELYQRAKDRGLALCPAEVGPHLRLADADQQRGMWYWIAMEPIFDSYGDPHVFFVERGGAGWRWLRTSYAIPKDRWLLFSTIVFAVPVRK